MPLFDRNRLRIQPLGRRSHDLTLDVLLPLDAELPPFDNPAIRTLADRLVAARHRGSARILLMGAHVLRAGIGYDILHEHPNCDGAAYGATSYRDFLTFAHSVAQLEGGVVLNFGSAVMGPEVYLKALAMARNVAHQDGKTIRHFTTAVFDLIPLEGDTSAEAPRGDPRYYYRPWKTILVRTVADGGESFYVQGDHAETVPAVWKAAVAASASG